MVSGRRVGVVGGGLRGRDGFRFGGRAPARDRAREESGRIDGEEAIRRPVGRVGAGAVDEEQAGAGFQALAEEIGRE
jgi:hypothetical protein